MNYDREYWKARLPLITAFANGEDVQLRGGESKFPLHEFSFHPSEYRIVPPPKPKQYRPWTVDEVPLGKEVVNKQTGQRMLITVAGKKTGGNMLALYTMPDGTPCGVEVDQ